jgi:NADH-quinone oxidoreductase subunit G
LKGSYTIIQEFQRLIKEHGLGDEVNLNASFCLGHCTQGVTVKIDEGFAEGVSTDNVEEIFKKYVLVPLGKAQA